MFLRRSGFAPLLLLAACGGAPPGAAVPPPPPDLNVNKVKEPPVDVSPVAEPGNLVVLARMNKPDAIVKTVATWTHLPLPSGKDLVRQVNETLADVLDLSQPLDAAVAVTISRHGVEPLFAFSVGVTSFDEAKARVTARYKAVPVTNGGLKIHGLLDRGHRAEVEDNDDDDDREVCILAHAAVGAKLVCGPGSAVDALTPYMARTMARETWKSDLHVEMRPEPVRTPLSEMRGALPMLARSMTGSHSQAVRELVDASVGEAMDIVEDAQKLTVDATINDNGVNATSRFEFRGNKSVFARALTDTSRAEPAPAAFWHLPGDTDTALFMRGSDPKLYDHAREILANLLTEGMDSAQLPPAEKKAVHDLVADKMLRLFTNGGTGIYAKGFDQTALDKALKARGALKEDDFAGDTAAKRAIAEQMIGWHLYQVSDPIAKVGPILKDWSALWNRPTFAKWVSDTTHSTAKELPKMRIAPMPAGVTLPKDAVHLEVSVPMDEPPPPPAPRGQPPKPAPKPQKAVPQKPVVVHVFAVPDGSATWLALGLDGKLVATKAGQALSSANDATSLGKMAQGVDLLKEPKINGGGLVTLRGLMVVTAIEGGRQPSPYDTLAGLPGKGALPIVFTGKAEGPSGNAKAGTSVGQLVVSRQVIEDLVKFAFTQR
jgi:hypothetical protein